MRSNLVVGLLRWLPVSLVLAFCFTPSVSASIFKAWHCLSFAYDEDEEHSFLAQQLSVRCDGSPEYNNVLVIAWMGILLWPVGMVAMYAAVLLPCRFMLLDNQPASPLLHATAFLHRDYKAPYFWWEIAALVERTVLTGWLILVDYRYKVLRLLAALMISIAFLTLTLVCRPQKHTLDFSMAAGVQLLFVCIFVGGIVVHLHEAITSDTAGSPELAFRLTGMRTSDEAVTCMIFVALAMFCLLGGTLGADAYFRVVEQRLRKRWSCATMDPPVVKKWEAREIYACFLSHYKMEAAADARYMHDTLRKMLRCPVFLDSSALNDLRELISEGLSKSETLLLLATRGVLTRPWCLIELFEAARKGKPIIVLQISNGGFAFSEALRFLANLEEEMKLVNRGGLDMLHEHLGPDLSQLKETCSQALQQASKRSSIVLDTHAGDSVTVASMKEIIEHMARATNRNIEWKGGKAPFTKPKLSVQFTRTFSLAGRKAKANERKKSISLEAYLAARTQSKLSLKGMFEGKISALPSVLSLSKLSMSSSRNSGARESASTPSRKRASVLAAIPEVSNPDTSAVLVVCSRRDAVLEARVLRAELATKMNRACAIGGGTNTSKFVEVSDAVVVLLTKQILADPHAIFEIWMALQCSRPLITVAITGKGYDFQQAADALSNFAAAMEADRSGSSAVLQAQLAAYADEEAHSEPGDTDIASVGRLLHSSLTAIIAVSWTPSKGLNHMDGVLNEIVQRIPRRQSSRKSTRKV